VYIVNLNKQAEAYFYVMLLSIENFENLCRTKEIERLKTTAKGEKSRKGEEWC
jgi:hypothetical protein